jgi:hypothetical protein
MATRKTLTFEKALTQLLGLMGTRVEVTLISEEPRGVLAYLEGELASGGELQHEGFAFRVGRAETASFVLERRLLRRAVVLESEDEGPDSLRFYVGITTVLQVDPVREQD